MRGDTSPTLSNKRDWKSDSFLQMTRTFQLDLKEVALWRVAL